MSNASASILAKLRNKAKEQKISFQQLLNLFCQEEFIRRLSKSGYKNNLILKGGLLLYTLSGFTARPTVDSDYLLRGYSNELSAIKALVNAIINVPSKNSFVCYEVQGIEAIHEARRYHGVRVKLVGIIGKTRTPFSVDFGVGDVVVPSAVQRELPVILPDFEAPTILTYPLESVVSEKLDAIISLMEATGRMKDFYDIYYLATTFDFDGRKLQQAIYETLSNRGTPYERNSVRAILRLPQNIEIWKRWDNFCNKVLSYHIDFGSVAKLIVDFASPPYQAMIDESEFFQTWVHKERKYC